MASDIDPVDKWLAKGRMEKTTVWRWSYNGSPRAVVRAQKALEWELWGSRILWRYITPNGATVLFPKTALVIGLMCMYKAIQAIRAQARGPAEQSWQAMKKSNGKLWDHIAMMRKQAAKIDRAVDAASVPDRAYIKRKLVQLQKLVD